MTDSDVGLQDASRALSALADGPARQAADALAEAFGEAGEQITHALSQAARNGELDFNRMAESILRDLARIASESVLSRIAPASSVSAHSNFAPGTDERAALGQSGAVAAMLARLVQGGGRFL